ncbi:MAG: transposase [Deltaproteobacteria bacterium]|nr:transposase [Deltaproteobacteria bacterium]
MSRPLRIQYPDAWYHVMNRGRRGEEIFTGKNDYNAFIELLKELVEDYNVRISAYCLMSNHYHLLVQTPDANISRSMRHLNGVYTQRFNRMHLYDGQLFRGRYKSVIVDGDSYLLELLRYIHRNPLEAGIVEQLNKYIWSSHKGYLSTARKWDWLHKDFILSLFSKNTLESITRYKRFVSKETPEEINQIFTRKKLPAAIGNNPFVDRIKEMFFSNKIHEEVPQSRFLAPDVDKIVEEVCKYYKVTREDILISKRGHFNEPRNVAIYLTRCIRNDTLKGVGETFGIEKNSTVGSVVARVKREIEKDRTISKRVETLKVSLEKS